MSLITPPPAGSNALRSRAYNRSLVLRHVRATGASGRAQIARESGLSTQAVSNIIADLVAEGWLVEAGKLSQGRGLPAMQYALDARAGLALGVEVRPEALLVAISDLDGRILFSHRDRLTDAAPATVCQKLRQIKAMAVAETGADRLIGAGVVMPGPFGVTGLSGAASDLPGWAEEDALARLSQALDLPVIIENDASAAAMAEMVSGHGQGLGSFACLYFGTGIGLGVIAERSLLRGARGNAGEIGQIAVPHRGQFAPLEQIASRFALRDRLAATGEEAETSAALEALFLARNPVLMDWLEDAGQALSHAVLTVENLYDPDTVIAGGALPEQLLKALLARVALSDRSVANRPGRAHPRLICGTCGPLTATQGAAALIINHAFTPRMAAEI